MLMMCDEAASTANIVPWGFGGLWSTVQHSEKVGVSVHQAASRVIVLGSDSWEKGDFVLVKSVVNQARAGSWEWLLGSARLQ